MEVCVRYNSRDYGTAGCSAESYGIELSQHETPGRPKDAAFPHSSDTVRVEYKFNPGIMTSDRDESGLVLGVVFSLSVMEAEELARLLLDSIAEAKLSKAPVTRTVNRIKEMTLNPKLDALAGDIFRKFSNNPVFVVGQRKPPSGSQT